MQTLGKVPSARRPPANLPSLKAETSTPTQDQSGSWPAASTSPSLNVNNQQAQSNEKQQSVEQQQQQHYQNNTVNNSGNNNNNNNNNNNK